MGVLSMFGTWLSGWMNRFYNVSYNVLMHEFYVSGIWYLIDSSLKPGQLNTFKEFCTKSVFVTHPKKKRIIIIMQS